MIYLASPYSHPDERVRQARYELVVQHAAFMWNEGLVTFSPIAHSHPIAQQMPPDSGSWEQWAEFDRTILGACSELWVLMLPGWRESVGVAAEVEYARSLGLPVKHIEPLDERTAA